MSFLERVQSFLRLSVRRTRKTARVSATGEFFEHSPLVSVLILLLAVIAIAFTTFVGVNTARLPVLPNQTSRVRIVATTSFSYVSELRTRDAREELRASVPPVYRLEFGPYQHFATLLQAFSSDLETIVKGHPADTDAKGRLAAVNERLAAFNANGPYSVAVEDVLTLLEIEDPARRATAIADGLAILRSIYSDGVHDGVLRDATGEPSDTLGLYQILRPDGQASARPIQSMDEAMSYLRVTLRTADLGHAVDLALFRLFRNGLTPNLVYDDDATRARQETALHDFRGVTVNVERGQTIIEPDQRVTPEQFEMLQQLQRHLHESQGGAMGDGLQLLGRVLLVLGMVLTVVFYLRLEDRETLLSNSRLALLALVLVLNLGTVRVLDLLSGTEFFLYNSSAAAALPFVAPVALAPLIVAVLLNAGAAMFLALFVCLFTSVIHGQRLELFVATFVACCIAINACRAARRRGKLVRAGLLAGLTLAICAALLGVIDQLDLLTVVRQIGAALVNGLLTGIAVVGLLPLLEGLFKRTTDITLLELTDFNHPLLRLLQLEAPGSYHHSIVVAQLAENAAAAIGANPLLTRVCALFHDIGKTVKPEFFAENQRDGINPHDDHAPSFSALIIKSHVKEGVDLALKHKLPRPVIDAILQHHGTTLIRYFYHRAVTAHTRPPMPLLSGTSSTRPPVGAPAGGSDSGLTPSSSSGASRAPFASAGGTGTRQSDDRVCETTYRYDGPRPQSKETAIIMLADGVEAAARAQRRITPQHLGEVIDGIFEDRISDGQLNDTPLTFAELYEIKTAFIHTLLNMMHGRVAYPAASEAITTSEEEPERREARV